MTHRGPFDVGDNDVGRRKTVGGILRPFTFLDSLPDGTPVVEGHIGSVGQHIIDGRRLLAIPCECCRRWAAVRERTLDEAPWTPLGKAGFIEHVVVEVPTTTMHALIRPMVACSDACERTILAALGRDPDTAGLTP